MLASFFRPQPLLRGFLSRCRKTDHEGGLSCIEHRSPYRIGCDTFHALRQVRLQIKVAFFHRSASNTLSGWLAASAFPLLHRQKTRFASHESSQLRSCNHYCRRITHLQVGGLKFRDEGRCCSVRSENSMSSWLSKRVDISERTQRLSFDQAHAARRPYVVRRCRRASAAVFWLASKPSVTAARLAD